MSRLLALLVFLFAFTLGCGASLEPTLVAGIADVANRGADPLLAAYKQAGDEALATTTFTGDKARDDVATKAALAKVDARWEPVWDAWKALRTAELAYKAAYDKGEATPFGSVIIAFCTFRAVLPLMARGVAEQPLTVLGIASSAVCP